MYIYIYISYMYIYIQIPLWPEMITLASVPHDV